MARSSKKKKSGRHHSVGYVFYRPPTRTVKELVQVAPAAEYILSGLRAQNRGNPNTFRDISSLCAHWKKLFDQRLNDKLWNQMLRRRRAKENGHEIIHLFQSGERYTVKGTIFSDPFFKKLKNGVVSCLFILERIELERKMDLEWVLRDFKLNRRELEIVKLIFVDRSNKGIAQALGLSVNTVKAYLKLLMRKLGVRSRTGILVHLMMGKNSEAAQAVAMPLKR
jgi:DNA-binding CsgD family transcriptional regulator